MTLTNAREISIVWLKHAAYWCLVLVAIGLVPSTGHGLEAYEVLVVANGEFPKSVEIANYYLEKRRVPKGNLLTIRTTCEETCRRGAYEKQIAAPIRRYMQSTDNRWRIRCILIMYGVPLKIEAVSNGNIRNPKSKPKVKGLGDSRASVDSELALVMCDPYPLEGWILNPLNSAEPDDKKTPIKWDFVLMVSRLDGPTPRIVKRMIDDSCAIEETGLKGKAYFDARWGKDTDKQLDGYHVYDQSIKSAAEEMAKSGLMPVILEETPQLFQAGQCPDAAIYCGWYSLLNYIDAFDWQPGAVGYHIASGECVTLRKSSKRNWCKLMLENGVAATLGPVSEPFVGAFPLPDRFFGLLAEGRLCLAECYIKTIPYLSWKMVLVGDPLYRPFGRLDFLSNIRQ